MFQINPVPSDVPTLIHPFHILDPGTRAGLQFIELCILLGCDYLEPIRGVGPKSALKLMKEHGSLGVVVEHLRAKMQQKAQETERKDKKKNKKKALTDSDMDEDEERDVESEDEVVHDPPAASSDVDAGLDGDDRDDEDDDDNDAEERRKTAKAKADAEALAEKKKKKKAATISTTTAPRRGAGGVHVPDEWMWEEAKKLFEKPDVTPASEIEVSAFYRIDCCFSSSLSSLAFHLFVISASVYQDAMRRASVLFRHAAPMGAWFSPTLHSLLCLEPPLLALPDVSARGCWLLNSEGRTPQHGGPQMLIGSFRSHIHIHFIMGVRLGH